MKAERLSITTDPRQFLNEVEQLSQGHTIKTTVAITRNPNRAFLVATYFDVGTIRQLTAPLGNPIKGNQTHNRLLQARCLAILDQLTAATNAHGHTLQKGTTTHATEISPGQEAHPWQ